MVKIAECNCKHEFQDAKYGAGKRVFNAKAKKNNAPQEYVCTVCRRTIQ